MHVYSYIDMSRSRAKHGYAEYVDDDGQTDGYDG